MKQVNVDKELNKIQYGNRNKLIGIIVFLLVIIVIGSTYALYQVRHTNKLTHITVKQFYQNDLDLAVYVDGVKKVTEKDFPTKENGTNLVYTGIKCEDGKQINASWDYDDWSLVLESNLPNKCNVYFETRWKDNSGAAYPELYQGLIPVKYDNGEIHIADLASEWYDYDKHNWANAVLVTDATYKRIVNGDGTFNTNEPISLDTDILQMYVWIPRYRYKLWNAEYGISDPQMIEIEFENNTTGRSMGSNNGDWLTHPAFLFGDTELNGIWVGKFEPSDPTNLNGRNESEINEITILPNKSSMTNKNLYSIFSAVRNIEKRENFYNLKPEEVDTHPMKNMEWGAVAYLANSIYGRYKNSSACIDSGCEIWVNNISQGTDSSNRGGTATGCVGTDIHAAVEWNSNLDKPVTCPIERQWNKDGIKASTTGNIYGIYDMSGGAYEITMGVVNNISGLNIFNENTGFSAENIPAKKYYNLYAYISYASYLETYSSEEGLLGDSTREVDSILKSVIGAWYNSASWFPYRENNDMSFFCRGGVNDGPTTSSIFNYGQTFGTNRLHVSFRVVLTAHDGTD